MSENSSRAARAADLIWNHWQRGEALAGLPADIRPETRAEGYAAQAALELHSKFPVFGWKIAATSSIGQTHIGVPGPIAGRLFKERAYDDGAELPIAGSRMRVAEPEYAFRMARDLSPRASAYTVDEVMAAAGTLHPAIEVPDSRFVEFAKAGAAQLLADNACTHQVVIGRATEADWRSVDLSRHQCKASVAGKLDRDGIGSNVLGDPRLALTWLANELSALGVTLAAGQVVITGTCAPPLAFGPGDRLRMDFGAFGTVGATISAD